MARLSPFDAARSLSLLVGFLIKTEPTHFQVVHWELKGSVSAGQSAKLALQAKAWFSLS